MHVDSKRVESAQIKPADAAFITMVLFFQDLAIQENKMFSIIRKPIY